jgi:hypothetical protein
MKLKKGSAAAKAYMAKIRAKRGTKKVGAKKISGYKKPKLFKPSKKEIDAAAKRLVKQSIKKVEPKKVGSTLKLNPKEKHLGAVNKDLNTRAKSYHKDTKSHNVNIRVVNGINKIGQINLNLVADELFKLETDIQELTYFIKVEKNTKEKNRLKEIKSVKNNQFKALKLYLNTIAKFR